MLDYHAALGLLVKEGALTREQVKDACERTKAKIPTDTETWVQATALCTRLHELVVANGYRGFKFNQTSVGQVEKLLRIDSWHADEVAEVIEWAVKDVFWGLNIRSPLNLRKHFETLLIQMSRKKDPEWPISMQHHAFSPPERKPAAEQTAEWEAELERRHAQSIAMPPGFKDVMEG